MEIKPSALLMAHLAVGEERNVEIIGQMIGFDDQVGR
jgi:hypothetical protein